MQHALADDEKRDVTENMAMSDSTQQMQIIKHIIEVYGNVAHNFGRI